MRSRSTARPSRVNPAVQASDSATMSGSTWWWKAPAAANWVGPYDGEELQDRLVGQRVVHRVFQERVQQGGHDDEEEPLQIPADQHPDQQAQRGVAGGGQDEGDRDAP